MTSACITNDLLRNNTQVYLILKNLYFWDLFTSQELKFTSNCLNSSTLTWNAGTSKKIPLEKKRILISRNTVSLSNSTLTDRQFIQKSSTHKIFSTSYPWLEWFWCVLRRTIFSWAEPTMEQERIVVNSTVLSGTHTTNDINIIGHISRAQYHHNWVRLKRTHNTIWVWTAATKDTT